MDTPTEYTNQYSTVGADYRTYLKDKVFNLEQTVAKLKHALYAKDDTIEQLNGELSAERHLSATLEAHIIEFQDGKESL